jgi:hypothetical protein
VTDDQITIRDSRGACLVVERDYDGRPFAWIAPPGGNDGHSVHLDEKAVAAEIPWTVKPAPWTSFTADEEIKHLQARLTEAAQKVEDERDKTRAAEKEQAEAEQARWRAESALGRLKEQVRDVAALVGGDAA